jgi:hypothetical protein
MSDGHVVLEEGAVVDVTEDAELEHAAHANGRKTAATVRAKARPLNPADIVT